MLISGMFRMDMLVGAHSMTTVITIYLTALTLNMIDSEAKLLCEYAPY